MKNVYICDYIRTTIGRYGGSLSTVRADDLGAFSRANSVEDTTIGWRFVNPEMQRLHGTDSMPETAENVAAAFDISREDQDAFALRSQVRAAAAARALARGEGHRALATMCIGLGQGIAISLEAV